MFGESPKKLNECKGVYQGTKSEILYTIKFDLETTYLDKEDISRLDKLMAEKKTFHNRAELHSRKI